MNNTANTIEPSIIELSQILQTAVATIEAREEAGLRTCLECGEGYTEENPRTGLQCPDCFRKAVMASPLAGHFARYQKQYKGKNRP